MDWGWCLSWLTAILAFPVKLLWAPFSYLLGICLFLLSPVIYMGLYMLAVCQAIVDYISGLGVSPGAVTFLLDRQGYVQEVDHVSCSAASIYIRKLNSGVFSSPCVHS
jgi:hypothetical protein